MAIVFHKWKAEPSGMHSHAEHGNEEALAILSRFVFAAKSSSPESLSVSLLLSFKIMSVNYVVLL